MLGWVGSALLVYSVLQTRILRLRVFNGVASALLVIFNAAITVWPMVALNVTLTAINVFYIVRLLRGRHDTRTFEVVEISPNQAYLKHLLHEFDTDIQHFNPGFSSDDAAHTDLGFLILTRAETVGLVLARNAGDGSAQVELDWDVRLRLRAEQVPRRVREHHLRQWYVLGDLYDRAGDTIQATRWFQLVAEHDPAFVDVVDRLRALGR